MKYKIFGCKVNKYYTDKWLNSNYLKNKKGIFLATCVVTDKAKKKWIKFVKKEILNLKQDEKIYISGCGAFEKGNVNKNFFKIYNEFEIYKNKIELLGEKPNDDINTNALKEIKSKIHFTTKKFLVIQGGCDNFCTFCLTIQKRGKSFIKTKEEIVQDVLEFEMRGGKEVVLTGINIGAWGAKNSNNYKESKFAYLLKYILKNTSIGRIRLSSLGPEYITDEVLEIFKNTRIYPYFHISIQSGSLKILKKMNRNYNPEHLKNLLEKLSNLRRENNVLPSIGADLIVGFPGESQEDFKKTLQLIKDYNISKIHGFKFCAHKYKEQVPASFFPDQIDENIKKDRLKKLISLGNKTRKEFINSQKGKILSVLVELVKNGKFKGWSENYIECTNDNFEIISGIPKRNEIIIGKIK